MEPDSEAGVKPRVQAALLANMDAAMEPDSEAGVKRLLAGQALSGEVVAAMEPDSEAGVKRFANWSDNAQRSLQCEYLVRFVPGISFPCLGTSQGTGVH
ncbi:hypothetical protein [Acrocarpospora macrocephala]|uniref:hypothetical protein n=1 Tax=Acrocarpospora macrocephala TaxID=150177 RepID=UPI0012D30C7D|nr:hypothetical protein [Acrocarpospora macrocephala]